MGEKLEDSSGSAIERYKAAENRLFETCDVHGRSVYVTLRKPPLNLRVFDAGRRHGLKWGASG